MATSSFYQSSGSSPAAENTIDEQVSAAKTAATTATTASTEASTSATSAAGSLSSFQQYYLGAFSVAPSTTQQGAMYFDTAANQLKIWSGSAWEITASSTSISNTDDVSEGTANLYFTNERVDDRVNGLLVAGSNVTLTYDDVANTLTVAASSGLTDLSASDTDDLSEGNSNLYFTNARATSAITGSDLDMQGNKVLFGNMYSAESDLPSATTYHGMFAHVHGTGKGYFAHAGSWHKLLDETSSTTTDLTEGTNLYYTNARVSSHLNSSSATTGQFLKWTGSDFAWDTITTSAGGEAYIDINTSTGTAPSSGGTDSISIGKNARGTGADSIALGRDSNTGSYTHTTTIGVNSASTASNQLMLGAPSGYTGAFTSIRVGNSSYTPSNAMDLATKSYVDNNSGSGTSTFTGLTDTPASMGTSGQYLAVNSGGTALEFVAAPSGGGSGIALTDLSVATAAVGTAGLAYNSGTGVFTFTPPDLSGYATTASLATVATSGAYADITGTPTLATVATSGAYADLTGTPSLSGYLTAITGENIADLSDVNNTTPTDGQILTWDNTNSYWKPADASSGGSSIDYLAHGTDADVSGSPTATGDNAIGFGYGASGSGADSIAIGNEAVASGLGAIKIGRDSGTNPISGTTAIGIGWNASATALQSIAIGQSASATSDQGVAIGYAATAGFTESMALGKAASTTATNQLMLGAGTSTDGFTSIRVGNTSYTPTNNLDLATKAYVDANAGGGGVDWADVSTYHNLAPTTAGNYGMSLGFGAAGTGLMSIALGYKAKASGQNAINISAGPQSGTIKDASGTDSIVIGTGGEATASDAIAIGDGASADAARSISIGRSANVSQATYTDSVAIGNLASANAANQIMLGGTSITSVRVGNTSYAPSDNMDLATKAYVDTNSGGGGSAAWLAASDTGSATASGSTSLAVGDGSVASGTRSVAIGYGADSTDQYTVSLGHFAEAFADSSTALGYDTNVSSTHANSIALGRGATTTAARQLMLGKGDTTFGLTSIRVGNTSYSPSNNMDLATKKYVDDNAGGLPSNIKVNGTGTATATGADSIAIGNNTNIGSGYRVVSIGEYSTANSEGTAIGAGSSTSNRTLAGFQGVAVGYRANGFNNYAVSVGGYSSANGGTYTTALGYATQANAQYAVAIGYAAVSAYGQITLGSTNHSALRCNVTSITSLSDRRDKTEITDLDLGLDFVNAIAPKSFYRNERGKYYLPTYTQEQLAADDTLVQSYTFDQAGYDTATQKADKKEFGWIAQDVDAQLPAAHSDARLTYNETDDLQDFDVQRFTAGDMLPIAWKALRELSDKHDQLQSDYDALLARVVALENA